MSKHLNYNKYHHLLTKDTGHFIIYAVLSTYIFFLNQQI